MVAEYRVLIRLSAFAALALLPASAPPDILPPGHHSVQHELVLEATPDTPIPPLVAFPTRGFGTDVRVVPGAPFWFSSKYGTRIYELQAGEPLPREYTEEWRAAHRALAIPVVEVHSLPMLSPVARVRTTLHLVRGTDGLRLVAVRDERFDRAGNPVDPTRDAVWLLLLSAAGAVWLVRLGRARSAGRPA